MIRIVKYTRHPEHDDTVIVHFELSDGTTTTRDRKSAEFRAALETAGKLEES